MVRFTSAALPSALQLRTEMDRLVSSLFSDGAGSVTAKAASPVGFPPLNLWEEESRYVAEAELPGVHADDLEISVLGREVAIKGRRTSALGQDGAEPQGNWISRERGEGEFERRIRLPLEVDAEQIEANLTNGVLTLALPKAHSALPRQIKVNAVD